MRRLFLISALVLALGARAEESPGAPPRVGLALSGGGARGLAHIGVLKVVEEAGLAVDVVSGTSMGSVIGGLYAIGYTPSEIERIAIETDWADLFSDRLARSELTMKSRKKEDRYLASFPVIQGRVRLPAGLVSGQHIYELFVRLAWPVLEMDDFRAFPRPFACVATDIATGEAVVFDHGYLPDAMRASISIPSVFVPIRIGGRLFVDGGIVRGLPAQDAKSLGADIIVGVDVGGKLAPVEDLESFLDILNQSFDIAQMPDLSNERALCRILIEPDLEGIRTIDYDRAADIIRAGEESARAHLDLLRALADSIAAVQAEARRGKTRVMFSEGRGVAAPGTRSPADPPAAGGSIPDSIAPAEELGCGMLVRDSLGPISCSPVRVDEIEVRGLRDVSERFVLAELGFRPPRIVTVDELETAVRRLYSSGYFTGIRYRFERTNGGRKLVVSVDESSGMILNAGLRYDSHWRTSLLLNATIRNLLEHGSQFEFDVLLGDRWRVEAEYALHTGIRRSVGARLDIDWLNDHIDEYQSGERVCRWGVSSVRSGLLLETLLSRVLYAAAGLNAEWFEISPDIAPAEARAESERIVFISADIWIDALDRLWFTRRGAMLRIRGEAARAGLGSDVLFERACAEGRFAVPLHRLVVVRTHLFLGMTGGEPVPLHYRFFVGGENSYAVFQGDRTSSFHGYRHQELAGRHAFTAEVGLQIEPFPGWYLSIAGNAGNAVDDRGDLFRSSMISSGGAVSIGAETPAGPVEFLVSYSERNHFSFFLNAGFPF